MPDAAPVTTTPPVVPPPVTPAAAPPAVAAAPPVEPPKPSTPAAAGEQDGAKGAEGSTPPPKGALSVEPTELKPPEGLVSNEAVLQKFKGLAEKAGLKPEQAQEFLNLQGELAKLQGAKAEADKKATRAEWAKSLTSDSEYGGAKFSESVKTAQRAVATFGTPALVKLLDETGLTDHPELVRAFYRVGLKLKEDSSKTPGSATPPPSQPTREQQLERLYPIHDKPKGPKE